jgi:2-dehydro-3-deoxygluconokinase
MVAYDPNLRLQRWSLDDAKEALWSVLPLLDVIFPSAPEETKALFGYERPLDVIGFLWDRGVSIVVVKNGEHGCMVGYDGKIKELSVPQITQPVKYVELIGSVFNGAFLHSIAKGNDPFAAAELAIKTASAKGITGNGIDSLPLLNTLE